MIELTEDCPKCGERMFLTDDGKYHTETGTDRCPKHLDPAEFKRIMERITKQDAELLRRLAD